MNVGNRTIVTVALIAAMAAIAITALIVLPGKNSENASPSSPSSTSKPVATTTSALTTTSTATPSTTAPAAPSTTTSTSGPTIYTYDSATGRYDIVAWQAGYPIGGADNGPYYCCHPPAPDGANYSDSRGCSGSADSGTQMGGYMMDGQLC